MRFLDRPALALKCEKEKFAKIGELYKNYTSGEIDRVSYVKLQESPL